MAADRRRPVQAGARPDAVRPSGRHDRHRRRAERPRDARRLLLHGRLVRLRRERTCAGCSASPSGGLLAYLLRRRRPRAAARSCARPSGRRSTRPSSRPTAATRPATRARTRASTTSGASTRSSTPGRRHYPAADPLDQPPDLPAGRRGRRHHGGAGGGEPRGDGTPGDDVIVGTPGDDVIRSGSGDDRVDGGGGFGRAGSLRPGRGPRPRRSPRSARRRARTPRRPAPACRRRGARAGALATTGSRRTRGGP